MTRRHITAACAALLVAGTIQVATASIPSAAAGGEGARPGALFPDGGRLSPRVAALAGSKLGTQSARQQARALSLPVHGAGSLMRRGDRVVVEVLMGDLRSGRVAALRRAGARIEHVSRRYATVTAAAEPSALDAIGAVRGVRNVREVLTPMLAGAGPLPGGPVASATCPQGGVTSEGDAQLRADLERAQLHGTGSGVTVGVLSDSYDRWAGAHTHAAGDVASGDLPGAANPCGHPTPVRVVDDSDTGGEDEGRGMLQIVHDLAPDAHLAFATAFTSETAFADNIRTLAKPVAQGGAGAKVIVDDVTYFDEPFYQDGPVADAVNDVTAAGVDYYSSAANNNLRVSGKDVGSWEAPAYRPTACPGTVTGFTDCMDFDPLAGTDNTYGLTLDASAKLTLELQWAEPWYGVTDNLHLLVLNSSNAVIGDFSGSGVTPFAAFTLTAGAGGGSYHVVLARPAGSTGTPRVKLAFLQNGLTGARPNEYTQSNAGDVVGPTIFGHNGGANTISVAAVPYDDASAPESYSSRGPVTLFFKPVNGTTPAAPLGSPQVLAKPDLAATDCGQTTFFLSASAPYRFCGTSAAAPHAAAIAALELSLAPTTSRAALLASQKSTARPVGSFAATAVGAGLMDALAAAQQLGGDATPPTTRMTKPTRNLQLGRKIALAWSGTDSGTGVKDYTVQMAKAPYQGTLGAYAGLPAVTATTRTSAQVTEAYGATYCFRVSARDKALNVSSYSAARCVSLPVDDRAAKASAGWSRKKGPTPSKTLSVSTEKGATLTLAKVAARRLGVVVQTCRGCGRVKVSFGTSSLGTVNLAGKHSRTVVVLFKAFPRTRVGTLRLKAISKGKRVQVDGFVVSPASHVTSLGQRGFGSRP